MIKIDLKNKKHLYIVIGGSALLLAGIITVIVLSTRKKNVVGKNNSNINKKKMAEAIAKYPQTNAEFPLKKGSVGLNVINVNVALGLAPTNEFTDDTEMTLVNKFNKKEISKYDYDFFYKLIKKYL